MRPWSIAWLSIGVAAITSCHRQAVVTRDDVDPSITAWFSDTTPSTMVAGEGRAYNVQNPSERQSLQATLTRERGLWRAAKPQAYRFLMKSMCFCPLRPQWLLLEVRAGRQTRAWDNTGKLTTDGNWTDFNVDMLYDNLSRLNDQMSGVQIAFDERLHYPRFLRTSMIYPDGWSLMWIRALRPI